MNKKRISVELDERTVQVLDKVARDQERSRAWLIRKVLDAATKGGVRDIENDTVR